jgi:hypothetical protein
MGLWRQERWTFWKPFAFSIPFLTAKVCTRKRSPLGFARINHPKVSA